jgi:hypothetical protein
MYLLSDKVWYGQATVVLTSHEHNIDISPLEGSGASFILAVGLGDAMTSFWLPEIHIFRARD